MKLAGRERMAVVLLFILVPVFLYLVADAVSKIKKGPAGFSPVAGSTTLGSVEAPMAGVGTLLPKSAEKSMDVEVQERQRKLADSQPRKNPFAPATSQKIERPAVPVTQEVGSGVLKATGIIKGGPSGKNWAIINGKMLSVGGVIDGWTVKSIAANEITLSRDEKKMVLKVGQE